MEKLAMHPNDRAAVLAEQIRHLAQALQESLSESDEQVTILEVIKEKAVEIEGEMDKVSKGAA
jgi:hypothetical protein